MSKTFLLSLKWSFFLYFCALIGGWFENYIILTSRVKADDKERIYENYKIIIIGSYFINYIFRERIGSGRRNQRRDKSGYAERCGYR